MPIRAYPGKSRVRRLAAVLATLALVITGPVLGAAGPAAATSYAVACTPPSSDTTTYNPPLTDTSETETATTDIEYSPCVSVLYPLLISGSSDYSKTIPGASCETLLFSGETTWTIDWNTGATSTITADVNTSEAGAVFTVTFDGTVDSGLFAGQTVIQQLVGATTDITECELDGGTISSTFVLATLLIA
jgi:hypothetical protein